MNNPHKGVKMSFSYFNSYDTDTFQKCPTEWDLKKRWQARRTPSYATLIGSAIALALEHHYKGREDGYQAASEYVEKNYVPGGQMTLKGVKNLIEKGYNLGRTTNLGLVSIEAVEQFFGRTKPDLVGRNVDGNLVVVDHKVKVNLVTQYLEKELAGYDTSNQLFTYAWQVGAAFGEPITETLIHMIILGPDLQVVLHPVHISEEHLAHWRKGVGKTWEQMEAVRVGGAPEARYSQCMGKYGKCEMYDLCHVLHGDESKAETLYDAYRPNW